MSEPRPTPPMRDGAADLLAIINAQGTEEFTLMLRLVMEDGPPRMIAAVVTALAVLGIITRQPELASHEALLMILEGMRDGLTPEEAVERHNRGGT